jgi:GTP1/Obg family GTP-binding protein
MSVHYVVHDADGNIVNAGHCQDHMVAAQAHELGHTAIATEHRCHAHLHRVCEGKIVDRKPDPPAPPTYQELRRAAFGSIESVLEAILNDDTAALDVIRSKLKEAKRITVS